MMRRFATLSLLLLGFTGCSGSEAPITDPSKLPPLTAEQLEAIKKNDQQVEEEEGGAFLKVKAKYAARSRRRGSSLANVNR